MEIFHNSLKYVSRTWHGRWNVLQSQWNYLMCASGAKVLGGFEEMLQSANGFKIKVFMLYFLSIKQNAK